MWEWMKRQGNSWIGAWVNEREHECQTRPKFWCTVSSALGNWERGAREKGVFILVGCWSIATGRNLVKGYAVCCPQCVLNLDVASALLSSLPERIYSMCQAIVLKLVCLDKVLGKDCSLNIYHVLTGFCLLLFWSCTCFSELKQPFSDHCYFCYIRV